MEGVHMLTANLAELILSPKIPLDEYFPDNFKIYEFNAGENKISKEIILNDLVHWLRLKENMSFVYQCLLCNQEMTFSTAFLRNDYYKNRSHLLTKKHKKRVQNHVNIVGLLFNSPQKFVMCSERDFLHANLFELMKRITRRDTAELLNPKILNQVFCKQYKIYTFDRTTKKLCELERDNDIVNFMRTEVRPLFSMYCLLCNRPGTTYSQVVQHFDSRKHKKKLGVEKGVILVVRDFNIFITCSFNKLSSLLYLTHSNSFLEEIIVAGEGSIIISGSLTKDGKTEKENVDGPVQVFPIPLPSGKTVNESIKIKTYTHNFLDEPVKANENNFSVAKSHQNPQKYVTIYEFSDNTFKEHYAENMLFSFLCQGTRIFCSRCSLHLHSLEHMQSHLESQLHTSSIRNNEQVGFMCHVCNVFYIELKGERLAHVHSSPKNKKIIQLLLEDQKRAIDYNRPLFKGLMKAYGNLFSDISEPYKFCCIHCTDLTKKNLLYLTNHENEERHRRNEERIMFTLCYFCKVIFIDDGTPNKLPNSFHDHFMTHLCQTSSVLYTVFNIHGESFDASVDTTKFAPSKTNQSLLRAQDGKILVRASPLLNQYIHPGVSLKEFPKATEWSEPDLTQYLSYCGVADNINALFTCFPCKFTQTNKVDFTRHLFINPLHKSSVCFVKFCNICSEIFISSDTNRLQQHFLDAYHINNLLKSTGIFRNIINIDKKVVQECAELFSSEANLTSTTRRLLNEMKNAWNERHHKFEILKRDLHRILSLKFKNLNIELYGSQIARVATKDSDFDICLDIGNNNFEEAEEILRSAGGNLFKILVSLPDVPIPIIRATHISTGLQIDLCFSMKSEKTYCSQITKVYIDSDERVHWILAIIRRWFVISKLRNPQNFSSPAINWMVLFYLMQPDVQVIPSVSKVLDLCGNVKNLDKKELKLMWKPKSNQKLSCFELLEGFFHYYSLIRFSEYKLCPLTGLVVPQEETARAAIFIEDPFCKRNLAEKATSDVSQVLQSTCYMTLNLPWRIVQ